MVATAAGGKERRGAQSQVEHSPEGTPPACEGRWVYVANRAGEPWEQCNAGGTIANERFLPPSSLNLYHCYNYIYNDVHKIK